MNITKLNQYREDSYRKHIYHERASNRTRFLNNVFSITNIVLVTFTGIANNVTILSGHNKTYDIILSVMLYISLLLSGIQKYLKFEEKSQSHYSSSTSYSLLYKNIRDNPSSLNDYFVHHFHLLESIEQPIPSSITSMEVVVPDPIASDEEIMIDNGSSSEDLAMKYEMEKLENNSF